MMSYRISILGWWLVLVCAAGVPLFGADGAPVPEAPPAITPTPVTPVAHRALTTVINPTEVVTPGEPSLYRLAIGLLDNVEDHTAVHQDEAYNNLLLAVSKLTPEEMAQHASRGVTYAQVMKDPKKYRGVIVRWYGIVLEEMNVVGYPFTNPAGIKNYYPSSLVPDFDTGNGDQVCRFHLIDRPQKVISYEEKQRTGDPYADRVWIEGAFLKIETYSTRYMLGDAKPERNAPFLIGRRIIVANPGTGGETQEASQFRLIVVIVVIGLAVLISIVIMLGGRKEKIYEQQRREEWRKKAEAVAKKDKTLGQP